MRVWRSVTADFIKGLEVGQRVVDPRPALGAARKKLLWDGDELVEIEGADSAITAIDGEYVCLRERTVYECVSLDPVVLKVVHGPTVLRVVHQ